MRELSDAAVIGGPTRHPRWVKRSIEPMGRPAHSAVSESPEVGYGRVPSHREQGHPAFPHCEGRVPLLLTARRVVAGTLTLCLAACSAGREAARPPFAGLVVGVTDGDSITVLKDGRTRINVRLDGIDCPELGQDFGRRAKKFTGDLLIGRTVKVEPRSLDGYGRTVARVRVDGRDVSADIVRAGFAWHYLRYSSDPVLAAAEASARAGHRGLWAQDSPVPPWEFRAGRPRR